MAYPEYEEEVKAYLPKSMLASMMITIVISTSAMVRMKAATLKCMAYLFSRFRSMLNVFLETKKALSPATSSMINSKRRNSMAGGFISAITKSAEIYCGTAKINVGEVGPIYAVFGHILIFVKFSKSI